MKHKRFMQMCKDVPHLYFIYENHTTTRIDHAIREGIFNHLKENEANIYTIRNIIESTLERQIDKEIIG